MDRVARAGHLLLRGPSTRKNRQRMGAGRLRSAPGRPSTCITRQIAPRPDRLSRSACQACRWRQPFPAGPGLSPFACSRGASRPCPGVRAQSCAPTSLQLSAAGGGGQAAPPAPRISVVPSSLLERRRSDRATRAPTTPATPPAPTLLHTPRTEPALSCNPSRQIADLHRIVQPAGRPTTPPPTAKTSVNTGRLPTHRPLVGRWWGKRWESGCKVGESGLLWATLLEPGWQGSSHPATRVLSPPAA